MCAEGARAHLVSERRQRAGQHVVVELVLPLLHDGRRGTVRRATGGRRTELVRERGVRQGSCHVLRTLGDRSRTNWQECKNGGRSPLIEKMTNSQKITVITVESSRRSGRPRDRPPATIIPRTPPNPGPRTKLSLTGWGGGGINLTQVKPHKLDPALGRGPFGRALFGKPVPVPWLGV